MPTETPDTDDLPQAVIDPRRRVSLVWLIPLVALLAAAWLGYRGYEQQGPLITIHFQTADGLEAGKTRIRFKDVDVGVVERIQISPDLSGIRVQARMAQHVAGFLNDQTRFWVVRPHFSAGQISGLGTLLGGAFIAVDLTGSGASSREFIGLEAPPVVTATERGKVFTLHAADLGSLSVGSPVLHRGVEVGSVIGYELGEADGVDIQVFVRAPHDSEVSTNSRFWNVSGISMVLDTSGIRLQTQSLASVLLGGVTFDLQPGRPAGEPAAAASTFQLFEDRASAMRRFVARRQIWRLSFAGSVRGLLPGAPVELRGIQIGEVVDVELHLDVEQREVEIPVIVSIEPERLGIQVADSAVERHGERERALWERLVANGLRAQLKTGNLLTGGRYVDLDFYPDDAPRQIVWGDDLPQLPTVPTPLDELRGLLNRLAKLPLDRLGQELSETLSAMHETLHGMNTLLQRLDRETATELTQTLQQTRSALAGLERALKPSSPLQAEAARALRELGSAARSVRIMADYLERHPEALLRGKPGSGP